MCVDYWIKVWNSGYGMVIVIMYSKMFVLWGNFMGLLLIYELCYDIVYEKGFEII